MSVKLIYGGVALGAKENGVFNENNATDFSKISLLKQDAENVVKYGTLEKNQFLLDGTFEIMPNNKSGCALWSNSISGGDGVFDTPLTLNVSFSDYYSSSGISLYFTDYYCNKVNIKWYQNETVLADEDFEPNSINYFCSRTVENYNAVSITFISTEKPYLRAKLSRIEFGIIKEFNVEELTNLSVIEEINPTSAEIMINTMDFSFNSEDVAYVFELQQPLKLYFNEEFLGTFFVDSSKRISKNKYDVKTVDYVGILENKNFMGDVYKEEPIMNVINSIFEGTNIPYTVDAKLQEKTISGHIPICTARDALVYICFAYGCKVTTSKFDGILISFFSNSKKRDIGADEIFQGASFEEKGFVTSVSLAEHNFVEGVEEEELYKGIDEKQTVIFNEPISKLNIQGGIILKKSANYAIISKTSEEMVLTGTKYIDQKIMHQRFVQNISSTQYQNDLVFEDCTLINNSNYEAVLQRLYDYNIGKKIKGNFKARVKNDNLGDVISYATEFMGDKTGRITRKKYNLRTNNITAEYTVEEAKINS